MYDSSELTPSYTKNYGNDSWQQPIWIAFLASLGIHAMLGINLEKIPLFSQAVKLPPTVGLVELTPEQIARLPQPKTEPEVSFSNVQPPSNISQIPQQEPSFPRLPSPPTRTPSHAIDGKAGGTGTRFFPFGVETAAQPNTVK